MEALAAERGGVDYLRLGPAGKRHILRDSTIASTAIVTHIFEAAARLEQTVAAARLELRWPSSADEVPIFAERLTAFATGVRRYTFQDPEERGGSALAAKRGEYGLKGGRSKDHQYNVKHFVRLMLLQVAEMVPHAFDDITVAKVAAWSPDENSHVVPVNHMTGAEVRQRFAVHVLMLGCWACLADGIGATFKRSNPERHANCLKAALEFPIVDDSVSGDPWMSTSSRGPMATSTRSRRARGSCTKRWWTSAATVTERIHGPSGNAGRE